MQFWPVSIWPALDSVPFLFQWIFWITCTWSQPQRSSPWRLLFVKKEHKWWQQPNKDYLEDCFFIHSSSHIVQQGISKGVLQHSKEEQWHLSLLSSHLDVHVLLAEVVEEAGHHLDVLDLDDNVSRSLSSSIHQTWVGSSGHQARDGLKSGCCNILH